jgi:hypothetical protein
MEDHGMLFSPLLLHLCALALTAGDVSGTSNANIEVTRAIASNTPSQDAAQENQAVPDLSGNWQVSLLFFVLAPLM